MITTRLATGRSADCLASIATVVPLCATCFYVEVVILGDRTGRFKYDGVSALESVNDLFTACYLKNNSVVKKSYRVSFNHYCV